MNLSDPIVLNTLGPFDSVAYIDTVSHEYAMQLPEEAAASLSDNWDILLKYSGPENCRQAQVYAFDLEDSVWVQIEDQRTAQPCWGAWGSTTLTLRPLCAHGVRSLVDSHGVLRLRGDLWDPSATLIEMATGYRPIALPLRANSAKLAWTDDGIVIWNKQSGDVEWLVDSLLHYDHLGNRTLTGDLGFGAGRGSGLSGISWSGSRLWISSSGIGEGGVLYTLLSESGQPVRAFNHPSRFPYVVLESSRTMLWINGGLWIPEARYVQNSDPYGPLVTRSWFTNVDSEQSLDSTYSIVTRSFALDTTLQYPWDFEYDGERICALTDKIIRMDMEGDVVDSLPLSVRGFAFTWDGEAFWVIHRGPANAHSDNLLLSRFYPR